MSRMENLDTEMTRPKARSKAIIHAEGGMTEDDSYMKGGQLAAMFCIGFAFLTPSLLLWYVVL